MATEETTEDVLEIGDLDGYTDEQISQMDVSELASLESGEKKAPESGELGTDSQENPEVEAGGAADNEGSDSQEEESQDEVSDEENAEDTADPYSGESTESSEDDQSSEKASGEESKKGEQSEEVDFKDAYNQLMAPIKASKRTIKLDSVDDARRLIQMGVDYSRKMETLKPHLQVLRTLESNELTDLSEINFLIDIHKRNPDAIKKLLRDSEIDPIDLDMEEGKDYKPTDRSVSSEAIALQEVEDNLRDREGFKDTLSFVSDLDTASKSKLRQNPDYLTFINANVESGIHDLVMDRVAKEKILNSKPGLSDLELYEAVGSAMHQEGAFDEIIQRYENRGAPKPTEETTKGSVQDNGSQKPSVKDRRKAASPTRGLATGKKAPVDINKFSDDQIDKMSPSELAALL